MLRATDIHIYMYTNSIIKLALLYITLNNLQLIFTEPTQYFFKCIHINYFVKTLILSAYCLRA